MRLLHVTFGFVKNMYFKVNYKIQVKMIFAYSPLKNANGFSIPLFIYLESGPGMAGSNEANF